MHVSVLWHAMMCADASLLLLRAFLFRWIATEANNDYHMVRNVVLFLWTRDHISLLAEQLGAVRCLSITETCVVVGRCLLAQLLIADTITPNLSWPGLRGNWPPTVFLVTVAWCTVCARITHHAVNTLLRTRCLPVQCTPPGLIYARAGEMRAHNKVLVLQVRYPQVATGSRWYA
jgi:hypothetical protein